MCVRFTFPCFSSQVEGGLKSFEPQSSNLGEIFVGGVQYPITCHADYRLLRPFHCRTFPHFLFPPYFKKKKFYSSNCFRGAISHPWRGRVHTISIMAASQTIPRDYSKHFELLESFYRQQGGAEDKYKYSTFLNCCSYRPSENVTSAINLLLISANTSFYIT